jgi:hypothetical protein
MRRCCTLAGVLLFGALAACSSPHSPARDATAPDAAIGDAELPTDAGSPVDAAGSRDAAPSDASSTDLGSGFVSSPAFQLHTPRQGHVAVVLDDGSVLIAGGFSRPIALDTGELFDSAANTMTALTATMTVGREGAAGVRLPDGKVLIAGGVGAPQQADEMLQKSAEVFDPATRTFRKVAGTLSSARQPNAGVLLDRGPNAGKVLIAGGFDANGPTTTVDLYDPTMESFAPGAYPMSAPRSVAVVVRLNDGRVLFTGGEAGAPGSPKPLATADLYDPATGRFTPLSMTSTRASHSAVVLPDGKVLVAGGQDDHFNPLATAELFDPATNTFAPASMNLPAARTYVGAALLPSGKALLAGGFSMGGDATHGEIYDPMTSVFSLTASPLSQARAIPSVTRLNDGRVLIAGGQASTGFITTAVDLYSE